MAKGQKVSDLYLSLGIDLSELEADYVRADQSVSANMKRLQNEIKNTKLQLQVDASNINLSAADKVLATQQAINRQIDLQTEKVKLATAAWRQEVEATDAQSAAAQRLQSNMLREQLNLNKLQQQRVDSKTGVAKKSEESIENRLREKLGGIQENAGLIDAMFGTQIATSLGLLLSKISVVDKARAIPSMAGNFILGDSRQKISEALPSLNIFSGGFKGMESLKEAGGGLSTISKSLTGVAIRAAGVSAAIAAVSVALVKMSHSSIEAGEKIYKLAQHMHISYDEASRLNKAFGMVGVDAGDAGAALMRLDKQVLNAGTSGNAASRMLSAFGVSLRNGDGTLKDYNQQLRALADGYQRAKKAGMEEEYVTQTLGARGREMIDILEDYDKAMAMAGEVKGAGLLDPAKAHELSMEYRQMGMQAKQLGNGLSQALTPIASWVMPRIIELAKHGVEFLNEHREGVLAISNVLGVLLELAIKGLDVILSGAGQLFKILGKIADLAIVASAAIQGISFEQANDQLKSMLGLMDKTANEAGKIDLAAQSAAMNIINATAAAGKTKEPELFDWDKYYKDAEQAQQRWVEAHNRGVEMIDEANQIMYHSIASKINTTASEYAAAIYDVNLWVAQQWRAAQTADERAGIEALAAAKIAQAYENAAEKVKSANKSIMDDIYHMTHSQMDNELYDIKQKAQDFLRQGADPGLVKQWQSAKQQEVYNKLEEANRNFGASTAAWRHQKNHDAYDRTPENNYTKAPNISVSCTFPNSVVADNSFCDKVANTVASKTAEVIRSANEYNY